MTSYQSGLLSVMKRARSLGFEGRYRALAPIVDRAYDLDFLARRAVGRRWRTMTPAQRRKYGAAFRRLSIATHASRFKDYDGEHFEILGKEDAGGGYVLVRTRIVVNNGKTVAINYLMGRRGGAWKIVDVFLKGAISEVATRRSEFTSVLRDKGPDGLIAEIERKVAALRSP